jgi:hypothetical protein
MGLSDKRAGTTRRQAGFRPSLFLPAGAFGYTVDMKDNPPPPAPEFDAFRSLAAKLVQVPKAEADKQEAVYQRERKKKPKRGPKPR